MQIPLSQKGEIRPKCPVCSKISSIDALRRDEPYRLPNPAGGSWPITYWHCACGKILIYEPGDGGDLVLLENVELAK